MNTNRVQNLNSLKQPIQCFILTQFCVHQMLLELGIDKHLICEKAANFRCLQDKN